MLGQWRRKTPDTLPLYPAQVRQQRAAEPPPETDRAQSLSAANKVLFKAMQVAAMSIAKGRVAP